MAKASKERMVTRTINSTIITAKCYNKETKDFESITKTFTGKMNTEDEFEIFSLFDTMKYRAVEIEYVNVLQAKYALPERLFIAYGKMITDAEAEEYENE